MHHDRNFNSPRKHFLWSLRVQNEKFAELEYLLGPADRQHRRKQRPRWE